MNRVMGVYRWLSVATFTITETCFGAKAELSNSTSAGCPGGRCGVYARLLDWDVGG